MKKTEKYLKDVADAAGRVDLGPVESLIELLSIAYRKQRGVFVVGNGGSASNASHLAQDLSKGTLLDSTKKRFRVLSLADNMAFVTAVGNDIGFDRVFEFQLRQFADKGDVLIAVSGSGNSPNVLRAASYARKAGMKVVSFTGFDGGRLIKLADVKVHVPCTDMCKTEAVHSILFHMVTDLLKARLAVRG